MALSDDAAAIAASNLVIAKAAARSETAKSRDFDVQTQFRRCLDIVKEEVSQHGQPPSAD